MARTSKPREAALAGDAPVGSAPDRPRGKPAASGRRSAKSPRPATGEPGAAPPRTRGRGGKRGRASAAKPAAVEPQTQATAPPAPPEPSPPPSAEVAAEIRQLRLELAEALPLLGAVPRQVNEFRSCLQETGPLLLEVVRQLREAERGTREAREQLDRLREECAAAESFLAELRRQSSEEEGRRAALLEETSAAEARLGALRRESADAEGILRALRHEFEETRQWLDEQRRQPPPAAPSPTPTGEGQNRLGATVDPGVVVAEVLPGTPADDAGLAMGDVILAVNGTDVFSGDELRDLVREIPSGEEITLRVERAGLFEDIKVRLEEPAAGAAPMPEGHNRLGVTVEPGVVVAEVLPGTPAADAALMPGDVILSVDGTAIFSGPQLRELIHKAPAGAAVALQIERGQDLFEVRVPLEPVSEAQTD
jgi:hypothetical protein